MSTTQIKRLFQSKTEFVPITLAEAVVVNTSNLPGLSSLGITTLDKVLRTTMGVVGTNAADIAKLKTTVQEINRTNLLLVQVLLYLQMELLVLLIAQNYTRQLLSYQQHQKTV